MQNHYFNRVDLLLSVLQDTVSDSRVALKGGTALNLFILDMPRLSVDIDLTYLPMEERATSFEAINSIFLEIQNRLHKKGLVATIKSTTDKIHKQIIVEKDQTIIKIEINHVLRGAVNPPQILELRTKAQKAFNRFMSIQCLSTNDLYAGKLCAALDRKHPRDLFDMHCYLEKHTYSRELHLTFLVYLISNNRPISELIKPNPPNIREVFEKEFDGMVEENITIDCLQSTFEQIV